MTCSTNLVVGLSALTLFAAGASAQFTIGDFEGSDAAGTWGYWNNGVQTPLGDDPTLEFSTEDASSGSTSIKASNAGYAQNLAWSAEFETREEFLNYDTLVFDVVFPEYSTSGFWEIFEFVINSNAGFNNLTGSLTNSEGGTNQVGWSDDGSGRRLVTFELDYSSQLDLWGGEVPTYLEFVISLNNDSVHNVAYLDNFRLVPTPGAVGVFAVAACGAVGRRRR